MYELSDRPSAQDSALTRLVAMAAEHVLRRERYTVPHGLAVTPSHMRGGSRRGEGLMEGTAQVMDGNGDLHHWTARMYLVGRVTHITVTVGEVEHTHALTWAVQVTPD